MLHEVADRDSVGNTVHIEAIVSVVGRDHLFVI